MQFIERLFLYKKEIDLIIERSIQKTVFFESLSVEEKKLYSIPNTNGHSSIGTGSGTHINKIGNVSDVIREYELSKRKILRVLSTNNRDFLIRIAYKHIFNSGVYYANRYSKFRQVIIFIKAAWRRISLEAMDYILFIFKYSIDQLERIQNNKDKLASDISTIDEIISSARITQLSVVKAESEAEAEAEADTSIANFSRIDRSLHINNIEKLKSDSDLVDSLSTLRVPIVFESSPFDFTTECGSDIFDEEKCVRAHAQNLFLLKKNFNSLFDSISWVYNDTLTPTKV